MKESLDGLVLELRRFANDREWHRFHSPKNLVMTLAAEVGELLEPFQWMTEGESARALDATRGADIEDEIADVLIYLVRLADVLGIDLIAASRDKVRRNEERFPTVP